MMKKYLLSLFFSLTLLPLHAEKLRINIGWPYPQASLVKDIIETVFKEAKIDIETQVLPNKRSLMNANEGIDDGDATRIWHINKFYPNLLRVPVQIYKLDIVAISNKKIIIRNLDDLKPYNIGVVRGMKIVEVKADALKPKSLIKINTHESLIKMLKKGRIDIVLSDKRSLLQEIKKENIKGLYLLEKPLMVLPMFIHLYKKHKGLIPKLTKAATKLQEQNILTKIDEAFTLKVIKSIKHLLTTVKND